MHIISQKKIREAKQRFPEQSNALDVWYRRAKRSYPSNFAELKNLFPATDKVGDHFVFDIGGNHIRLIALVHFQPKKIYIREVLSHKEYDKDKWKEK